MKYLKLDNVPENFKFAYNISLIGYSTTFVDLDGDSWFISNQKLLKEEAESEDIMIKLWNQFEKEVEKLNAK